MAAKKRAAKTKASRTPANRKPRPKTVPWQERTAGEIMRTDLLTLPMQSPLKDVERLLGEHRISGLPVTNEAGRIVGVVSMRDLLDRYSQDPDARPRAHSVFFTADVEETSELEFQPTEAEDENLTAADVMNPEVYSVNKSTRLPALARKMVDWNVHRVLVEDRGKHVGLITTMDVLASLAGG
jgi:CBS domain-containing protein